jgi:hypothetical protein
MTNTENTENTEYTENTENTESLFDGGEFVLMQNAGKEIVGGGYKINSFFLKEGKSPITTYNNPDQNGDNVSCQFENFAVPAGLFLMRVPLHNKHIETQEQYYQPHEMASDDLIDKLFGLVEANKKHKRKTRKHHTKLHNKKTRKYTT